MPFNDSLPPQGTDPWYTPLVVNFIGGLRTFVNNLETIVSGKASSADLSAGLATKVNTSTYTAGMASKADLVGGFIPTAQIPAVAITAFLGPTASQAAMLALIAQPNDYTIRTDIGAYAVLTAAPATTLANWYIAPLGGASAGVMSVNDDAGPIVVLDAADVGARAAGDVPWGEVSGKPSTFAPTIGTTATTAVAGNDARLTDQRVPTSNSVDNTKVADGALAIGKVNGLSGELDARVVAMTEGATALWAGPQAVYDAMDEPRPAGLYLTTD